MPQCTKGCLFVCVCVCLLFSVCQGGGGLLHQDRFKTKNWIHSFSRQNEVKRKNTVEVIHPIRFTSTNKKKLCFINLEVGRHYRSPPYIQLCLSIFGGETWGTAPIYGTFFKRTGHLGHTILALYPQREKKKEKVSSIIQRDSGQPHSNRRPWVNSPNTKEMKQTMLGSTQSRLMPTGL